MIGFIGLGDQGGPMAHRILAAGLPLTVFARRDAVRQEFSAAGAAVAGSVAELASRCDIVAVCVVDEAGVEDVVHRQGLLGALRPGSIIVVHSTIHPEACVRLAEAAGPAGVSVLDAPVSGMAQGAREGTLVVMVGGPEEAFRQCHPIFATYGRLVVHAGPTGAGQRVKALNNLLAAANWFLAHEAVQLGRQSGLEPQSLAELLLAGTAQSRMLDVLAQSEFQLDLGREGGPAQVHRTLKKDVTMAKSLLAGHGADPGDVGRLASKMLDLVREAAHLESDEANVG